MKYYVININTLLMRTSGRLMRNERRQKAKIIGSTLKIQRVLTK